MMTTMKFPLGKMYKLNRSPSRGDYRTLYASSDFVDINVPSVGEYILGEPFVLVDVSYPRSTWVAAKILTLDGQLGWTDFQPADLELWK